MIFAGNRGGNGSLSVQAVPPPAYLVEKNAQGLDFSSLIPPDRKSSAAKDALSCVNAFNASWPELALDQYTSLDPAQKAAIKVAASSYMRSVLLSHPSQHCACCLLSKLVP